MNLTSILVVALALMSFLVTDATSAPVPSGSNLPTQGPTAEPYSRGHSALLRDCLIVVGSPGSSGLAADTRPVTGPRLVQAPDTIADCRETEYRSPRAKTADFSGAPAWGKGRVVHF